MSMSSLNPEEIRSHREMWTMSREDLAEKVGVPVETVIDWEEGLSPVPVARVAALRRALGVGGRKPGQSASVVGQLITPKTIKPAANDYSRALTMTLAAERITGHVEPIHMNADMERGTLDEPFARDIYSEHYAPATEVGFMVRDFGWGRIGYSPDGLVGDDGLIEIKSRRQKKQLATILSDEVPLENMAQIQAGLLVSGRDWLDYVSYCGGMPLYVKRVMPDEKWFTAIKDAVKDFELSASMMLSTYELATVRMPETERINHYEEMVF